MRIRNHTNPFNFNQVLVKDDFSFVTHSEIDVEIGFGRGKFLRKWALLNPDRQIVGVDVRQLIVRECQHKIQDEGISNIELVHSSGERFIEDLVVPDQIQNVFVFHPDPWFKKRHLKRRLINPQFLQKLSSVMKVGGTCYISTDVEPLYHSMIETFQNHPDFELFSNSSFFEEVYFTHWASFREQQGRECFTAAFKKLS